ncbi:MAG: CCA tRNA nucleotidyltransferase, partial [Lachnospiraceae bacterium]
MRMEIPQDVEEIIDRLNRHGFEAFAVGGCVRDTLLGRQPGDWDITTSAKPEQVKAIFGRTIDTGIEHGTVTIMREKNGYEVTTYRIDGEYEDGRHPKSVEFTSNLLEDLKRRDFTINAMAYSHQTGIVDAFGGVEDLDGKLIRCVGNPIHRFTEDALRILRAIRFSAQLGFSIEEQTYQAIGTIAPNLIHVSKERIQVELTKLLLSDHPEQMQLVFDSGISPFISPAFHRMRETSFCVPASLPAKKSLRWAAFLAQASEADAVEILRDLKLDNDTISRVRVLNRFWEQEIPEEKVAVRRVMSQMAPDLFDELLELKLALAGEKNVKEHVCVLGSLTKEIRSQGDCIS